VILTPRAMAALAAARRPRSPVDSRLFHPHSGLLGPASALPWQGV